MTADIRVRRVYADPQPDDGARVLMDRVWPRGLRKDAARLDDWAKDAAPSAELRTWYQHDPAKFGEFRRRYTAEFAAPAARAALGRLRGLAGDPANRHPGDRYQPGGGPRRPAAGGHLTSAQAIMDVRPLVRCSSRRRGHFVRTATESPGPGFRGYA